MLIYSELSMTVSLYKSDTGISVRVTCWSPDDGVDGGTEAGMVARP